MRGLAGRGGDAPKSVNMLIQIQQTRHNINLVKRRLHEDSDAIAGGRGGGEGGVVAEEAGEGGF